MRTSLLKSIIFIKINSEDGTELLIFFMKRSGYYRKSLESFLKCVIFDLQNIRN